MNDTDPDERPGSAPQTTWVTIAEAAEKSGVDTGTVRQWYRSGRLPTQRSQGDRGAFLVPLDAVVALGRGDEEGDAVVADLIDLNASYWSAQTEVAREEATAARNELADVRGALDQASGELQQATSELAAARDQLEFLRSQLQEASEDARQLRDQLQTAEDERGRLHEANTSLRREVEEVRAELDRTNDELADTRSRGTALENELDKLQAISSATGSITDNSWLSLSTNSYRSPVRPQGMAGTAAAGDALAGLIADTTPDRDEPGNREQERPAPAPDEATSDAFAGDEIIALDGPPAPTMATLPEPARRVKPVFGNHDDDLLPQPEKKGRRGRK